MATYSILALLKLSITVSPGINASGSVNGPLRVRMLSRYFLHHVTFMVRQLREVFLPSRTGPFLDTGNGVLNIN
jgi:hypothetical protein